MEMIANSGKIAGIPAMISGKIGVLMGGPSSEREISLKSGNAVFEGLKSKGVDVVAIDIMTDDYLQNRRLISSHKIDCAFIALHGRFGEDGQIQQILEDMGIPYTGSGVLASQLAMDKIQTHQVFAEHGLISPKYISLSKHSFQHYLGFLEHFNFPLVVKPATHGSSVGLSIVDLKSQLNAALEEAFNFDEHIIVEEYVKGRELTVSILDEKALAVIEIVTKNRFFDYDAKYHAGKTEYIVPAELDIETAKKVQSKALQAHRLLGCFGCSRVDIILSEDNTPYVLEINTIPGMTATSLLPKAAKFLGLDFAGLCIKLISLAYEKAQTKVKL